MQREYQLKYEIVNDLGEWEEFTNLVIGDTEINIGEIEGIGSESLGIDSLKRYATFTVHNDINSKKTVQPTLLWNPFQISRRTRIKVRTAKSTIPYIISEKGKNKNYIFLKNIKKIEAIDILSVNDEIEILTPNEANLILENTSQNNEGTHLYFNRIIKNYETVSFSIVINSNELDIDRIEIEGQNKDTYFVPNIDPDTVEILGYYKYSWYPWAKGYFEQLYFSDAYGIEYLYFPKEDDPINFPYSIESTIFENGGVTFKFNTIIPEKQRLVIALTFNHKEDVVIFDGYISSFESIGYHEVTYNCQDLSWSLDVMAINKTYPKGMKFWDVIKQILIDNNQTQFEFIYNPLDTATLTNDYKVEEQTIWQAIQKVSIAKGWALHFRYDRNKNKQVLIFEDITNVSYVTYQLSRYDIVGDFNFRGDFSSVRNVVSVIYKDSSTGRDEKIEIKDDNSISLYRKNRLTLGKDVTKDIITTNEMALNLAQQALNDLKDPKVYYTIKTSLMPKLKLNDELWYLHPNISEVPLHLRAYSIVHTLSVNEKGGLECYTSILGSGKITYKVNRWLGQDTNIADNKDIIIIK
ncbi:MAG: hypothetical protein ACRCYA_15280 [Cetobacterium sp.]|uniref:hypothetical protein n=1 Tax=Cetobacterium sp. TaxID=2071632 RepID=UPI003F37672B